MGYSNLTSNSFDKFKRFSFLVLLFAEVFYHSRWDLKNLDSKIWLKYVNIL